MIDPLWKWNSPAMVEDHRHRKAAQDIGERDHLLGGQIDLRVPPEWNDATRKRLDHALRRRLPTGRHKIEADAAHTEAVQALEFVIAHRVVHDGNATGVGADL